MGGDKQCVYRGQIVAVELETVALPNGSQLRMESVRHPGGAAVVARDGQGRVCMLRQYRPVLQAWVWELPAGKIEAGEPPQETARRELAEEAGLMAAAWRELGEIVSSPGVFDERIHLFLATSLSAADPCDLDEQEIFERHWLPFEELLQWARDGRIQDAKSIIALWRAAEVQQGKC